MFRYFAIITACVFGTFVHSFNDPISIVGRTKWNYTNYEENLWTREYMNTSLTTIYQAHAAYFARTADVKSENIFTQMPSALPLNSEIFNATILINNIWNGFAESIHDEKYALINSTASFLIPALQRAQEVLWNENSTRAYLDFFENVSTPSGR